MKITIVLPGFEIKPMGGLKVHYEYANGLQARGHQVTLVHPWKPDAARHLKEAPEAGSLLARLALLVNSRLWGPKLVLGPRRRLRKLPIIRWFPLRSDVRIKFVPDLRERYIPEGDIVVATGWQTAEMVERYSQAKGEKFYVVYDYEYWMTAKPAMRERIAQTQRADFKIIATSPAVQEMLAANGGTPIAYIPCGLDLSNYHMTTPVQQRDPYVIGFPVRDLLFKGTTDAIEAVKILRQKYGERLRVIAFGRTKCFDMPDWIEFLSEPTDADLAVFYNTISIFLFPSHYEGWGLPGTEALACGAALVTADSVGNRDYAQDMRTALVTPRQRPDLLAEAAMRLIEDDALRQRLAQQGHEHVQQYTWPPAIDAMEALFSHRPHPVNLPTAPSGAAGR